ncbi:membrane hypothetical protein [Cupriavidus taiwanensis]|uniref:Uncharacterized protein n=1 Tax=Cupriavidus taiwanensis TaxID=164546 RepID=A0A375CES4_9BURK|nr:hypothetical protein [Cupriavidus taiwanensis]SOY68766.1 membrane hypothetical protein [Cupriavidus taiwanensis]
MLNMDGFPGLSGTQTLKILYLCFVFLYVVPRVLVRPYVEDRHYLHAAIALGALWGANYLLLRFVLPPGLAMASYGAGFVPLLILWISLAVRRAWMAEQRRQET